MKGKNRNAGYKPSRVYGKACPAFAGGYAALSQLHGGLARWGKYLKLSYIILLLILASCGSNTIIQNTNESSQISVAKDFEAVIRDFGLSIDSLSIIYAIQTESNNDTASWIIYSSKGMANAGNGLPLMGETIINNHKVFFGLRTVLFQTKMSQVLMEKYGLMNVMKPEKKVMNCRFYGDSLIYAVTYPEYGY